MTREQWQSEELSKAIDALNSRQPYRTVDPEIIQLMKTADYVKEYGRLTEELALIHQLSAKISADTISRRRRKRLISSIVGAAAVALLFMGVYVQAPPEIAQQHEPENLPIPQVALTETAKSQTEKNSSITESPPVKPSPAVSKASKPAQAPELPNRAKTKTEVKPGQVKPEPPRVAKVAKSENVWMVLPNRTADVVSAEAGTVRHIYGQNSDTEIIITQRSTAKANAPTSVAPAPAAASLAKTAVPKLNKATRNVNGIEIVVEGKQPQAELARVAESLVPAESPDSGNREQNHTNRTN